jgi:DNA repair ATPase RecN
MLIVAWVYHSIESIRLLLFNSLFIDLHFSRFSYNQARMEKLSAKNGLEAFLYAVKNKMEDEAEAIAKVSTEEQREAVTTLVAASVDWLDDEGYDVATEVYKTKLGEVEGLVEPLYFRLDESTKRPEAVAMAEKRLKDIKLLVAKWETTLPQVHVWVFSRPLGVCP